MLQLGEPILERPELAHQLVVLGVGDLGIVEHVVAVAVVLDARRELLDAELGLGAARARRALGPVGLGTRAHARSPRRRPRRSPLAHDDHAATHAGHLLEVLQRQLEAVVLGAGAPGPPPPRRRPACTMSRSRRARRDRRRRARGPSVVDTPTPALRRASTATVIGSPPWRLTPSFMRLRDLDEVVAVARHGDLVQLRAGEEPADLVDHGAAEREHRPDPGARGDAATISRTMSRRVGRDAVAAAASTRRNSGLRSA